MKPMILHNIADWHADHAFEALQRGDEERFARHIAICDRIRAYARRMERHAT